MKKDNKCINLIKSLADIEIVKTKFLGAGSYGRVYKCTDINGKAYALKLYSEPGILDNEVASLKALAKNHSVKIPEIYFYGKNKNDDCILMEYIEGKNAFINLKLIFAPKKAKKKFADEVIDGLLAIHNIKADKFGFLDNPQYDNWTDYYKVFAQNIYQTAIEKNKQNKFDTYILDAMEKAWKHFDYIFSDAVREACLIHGDLNVMNIMVDKKLKVAAFIDPLNSIYADREYDLFQLRNLTGNLFGLYENYKSKYSVSEKCDIKCAFYSLWNEAMVYINTGKYTKFIMHKAINDMKKELNKI